MHRPFRTSSLVPSTRIYSHKQNNLLVFYVTHSAQFRAMEKPMTTTIENRIITVRGMQVMLDRDLAELYGLSTSRLNEQLSRNKGRFPSSFCFHLATNETKIWMSQNAISKSIRFTVTYTPTVFLLLSHKNVNCTFHCAF